MFQQLLGKKKHVIYVVSTYTEHKNKKHTLIIFKMRIWFPPIGLMMFNIVSEICLIAPTCLNYKYCNQVNFWSA